MNKKILLIDDSKTQLGTLKILFIHAGFDVETANDGLEGYKKIFKTAPDIVVSDIMMPKLNGYQFCRLVKDNPLLKSIPIVLLTVLEQKIDKFWSKKSGADCFLLKSSEINEIIQTINDLLEEHPVTEEEKQHILHQTYTNEAIQAELNHVLDNALMKASVLNEFRILSLHLEDNKIMAQNLFDLLSSILNYDLSLLIFNPPGVSEKEVYASNCVNIEEITLRQAIDKSMKCLFGEKTNYNIKAVYGNLSLLSIFTNEIFENCYIHEIKYNNEIIGAICFFGTKDKNVEEQKIFQVVLKEIDLLITIQSLYAQNKYLSLTDSLTGLYNRRYLMETLGREVARAKRYKNKLCMAMIDIDFFKKVNDTYGHQAGDFILKEVTGIIRKMLRQSDILFRYGGEEVLAIMPETDNESALVPIQRIRETIEKKNFVFNDKTIKVTISIGLSDSTQKADSLERFIDQADKAMYTSKQNGRNQVNIYHE